MPTKPSGRETRRRRDRARPPSLARRLLALGAGLVAALLGAVAATPAVAQEHASPALWRVVDPDSEVWLLGSVHMLPPDAAWRTPAIEAAYQAADVVYFEVSTKDASAAAIQQLLLSKGVNPPGVAMTDGLSPEARTRLARLAARIDRSVAEFDALKPWLAYLLLETGLFQTSGADPQYGVDMVLQTEAAADGKTLRFFETAADQVMILSDLPDATQTALLEGALESHEARPDLAEALLDAWSTGDADRLAELVFAAEAEQPLFFEAMFHRRNQAWLAEIERLLAGAETALIVVGAGHLVGDAGVPALLAKRGWSVERR